MKRLIAAALLAATATASNAAFFTGNALLAEYDRNERGFVQGYVAGVYDAYKDTEHEACMPEGVTLGQLVAVVGQKLRTVPAILHKPADLLVLAAIRTTWPCPTQQPQTYPNRDRL